VPKHESESCIDARGEALAAQIEHTVAKDDASVAQGKQTPFKDLRDLMRKS
jgi:hypothetical protein